MSDSQAYEKVTVGSDGITVTKRFEEDEFPVPAIAFEFSSERDEEVTVRLSDQVPEGVAVEDLGFHPEYGSEYWTIDEETITFERDLGANSGYTTVYGIRATGAEDVEQFLTEPVIEEVNPPLPEEPVEPTNDGGDEVIPESDDDVVKDVIAGDDEIPGLEEEGGQEEDDEEIETLDLKDPNATEQEGDQREGADEDEGDAAAVESPEGSIIAAMANEIRTNDVSVEDLKLLQRAFDQIAAQTGDGTTEARIRQLQTDIADLRAYTDALEEFLEENGTADQLIEDFEQQLDEFSDDLQTMQSELESNSSAIEDIDESVDSVSDEIDGVREQVDAVSTEVDDIGTDVEEMNTDVDDVKETVSTLDETVDELQSNVDELESQVTEGDVLERVEEIESQVSDLQEWQEQIKKTFGG